MIKIRIVTLLVAVLLLETLRPSDAAMTMKQIKESMETMRKACAPKFDVPETTLNDLKAGNFRPDASKDEKCYAKCIAQMAGTLTKKGEISFSKTTAQIEALLPTELKAPAKEALKACKEVHTDYKDSCDKVYYSVKCAADFNRDVFIFP
ncbi:AAEL014082-PA [Aedes aegypti]|uniref:AAEL014082-PA n=2 Tax=Aedes aegypti TaxID=7159 RepID=A0A1S4G109_AEDAE|nr:general odorant-binding protein lush [Aedes aegypti]EAT33639.1 AAEL014082-PA [Aedes aegypti]